VPVPRRCSIDTFTQTRKAARQVPPHTTDPTGRTTTIATAYQNTRRAAATQQSQTPDNHAAPRDVQDPAAPAKAPTLNGTVTPAARHHRDPRPLCIDCILRWRDGSIICDCGACDVPEPQTSKDDTRGPTAANSDWEPLEDTPQIKRRRLPDHRGTDDGTDGAADRSSAGGDNGTDGPADLSDTDGDADRSSASRVNGTASYTTWVPDSSSEEELIYELAAKLAEDSKKAAADGHMNRMDLAATAVVGGGPSAAPFFDDAGLDAARLSTCRHAPAPDPPKAPSQPGDPCVMCLSVVQTARAARACVTDA